MSTNAVKLWSWVTAMQSDPSIWKFHLKANEGLTFSFLDSQGKLFNPQTVGDALRFALKNNNRLEDGTELCVKPDERLEAEKAAKAEADRKAQAEADALAVLEMENETFRLVEECARYRGGNNERAVEQEKKLLAHWTLTDLRAYAEGIARAKAAKGLSAAEYKAQLKAQRPVQREDGYPELPASITRAQIQLASVQTLKRWTREYGHAQLNARLAQVEAN